MILTIDFDTIMEPSINFYNNEIGKNESISELLEAAPMVEQSLQADLYKYQYLTRLVTHYIKAKVPITFIESHEQVIQILRPEVIDKVDIINIDHHHDIAYDVKNAKETVNLGCGSWVKYGYDAGIINSYTWVKNKNSTWPESFLEKPYLTKTMLFSEYANQPFSNNIDRIFICASWEWIPPMYHPLLQTWISIYEEITGESIEFEKS